VTKKVSKHKMAKLLSNAKEKEKEKEKDKSKDSYIEHRGIPRRATTGSEIAGPMPNRRDSPFLPRPLNTLSKPSRKGSPRPVARVFEPDEGSHVIRRFSNPFLEDNPSSPEEESSPRDGVVGAEEVEAKAEGTMGESGKLQFTVKTMEGRPQRASTDSIHPMRPIDLGSGGMIIGGSPLGSRFVNSSRVAGGGGSGGGIAKSPQSWFFDRENSEKEEDAYWREQVREIAEKKKKMEREETSGTQRNNYNYNYKGGEEEGGDGESYNDEGDGADEGEETKTKTMIIPALTIPLDNSDPDKSRFLRSPISLSELLQACEKLKLTGEQKGSDMG